MKKYKNISIYELSVPGIGLVLPGEIITTDQDINNANFKLEKEPKVEKAQDKQEINKTN